MDSFSSHSKFEFRKMKVVICISTKLAFKPALLWEWKISNLKTESAKKIDYVKYIITYLCSSNTEILNISYQSIYFMNGFTFHNFHARW